VTEGECIIPDPLIAIIDDDASARNATRALIRSLGFSVVVFGSAAEFLASNAVNEAACLVTDLRMPGMTGLELCRHLGTWGRHIPTILVTAFPDEVSRAIAERSGVVAYLVKPLESDRLFRSIRSAIGGGAGPYSS
jgi:FixJ family two-component response regulator